LFFETPTGEAKAGGDFLRKMADSIFENQIAYRPHFEIVLRMVKLSREREISSVD
jgi:hypothetical protein